jgi:enoyl-CoA hydratase/carnithine racemase
MTSEKQNQPIRNIKKGRVMAPVGNPVVTFDSYRNKYKHVKLRREKGILEVKFHSDDGPFRMSAQSHAEIPNVFWEIAADHENKVIILTGTGDRFSTEYDPDFDISSGDAIARVHWEGHRILRNLLDVEAPVISAINGPLTMHCFPLVADITLCAEHATFQDPHVPAGIAAGDGAQIVWQHLLGPNRGKYFLFTGQLLTASEALALGAVNEVLPADKLLSRAWEIARDLALRPQTALRYTRLAANCEYRRLMLDLPFGYAVQNLGTATTVDPEWGMELRKRQLKAQQEK